MNDPHRKRKIHRQEPYQYSRPEGIGEGDAANGIRDEIIHEGGYQTYNSKAEVERLEAGVAKCIF